jgi:putative transposase
VRLPRIGQVRTLESTRKPSRHVERGTGRIRSATVSFGRRRWSVQRSKRCLRTDAEVKRLHSRGAHARADGLHKLTTGLVEQSGSIVVEDLNIAGMIRYRRLARRIADAGWVSCAGNLYTRPPGAVAR